MSENIIEFEKTDDWYVRQSEIWSKRGDAVKSLLYVGMAKGGGRKVNLRKAAAYYESGNFTPAVRLLTRMYRDGDRTGDLYALLVKTLAAMSRCRSALYFLNDAASSGAFGFAEKRRITSAADFYRAVGEIKKRWPDPNTAGETADVIYLVDSGADGCNETLIGDMLLNGKEIACSDMLFKATGIFSRSGVDPALAEKLLGACENNLFADNGMPRYDVLSAEIISLVSLGRNEEARMRSEELISYDLPENDLDLLKCSEAFIAARFHDGAREYLEELAAIVPNRSTLFKSAVASMATGDYFAARDALARLLALYPYDLNARRLLRSLPETDRAETDDELPGEDEIVYSDRLPAEDESELSLRVENMINFAEMRGGVPENTDMSYSLRYVLDYADDEYADYVCGELARTGMYEGLLKEYLLDIEGSLERKRAIVYALCLEYAKKGGGEDIEIYVYGYKTAPFRKFPLSGGDEALLRAYYYAYATYSVYGTDVPEEADSIFACVRDAVGDRAGDRTFVYDVAAAVIEICGINSVFGEVNSKGMTVFANPKKADKYAKLIEERRKYGE